MIAHFKRPKAGIKAIKIGPILVAIYLVVAKMAFNHHTPCGDQNGFQLPQLGLFNHHHFRLPQLLITTKFSIAKVLVATNFFCCQSFSHQNFYCHHKFQSLVDLSNHRFFLFPQFFNAIFSIISKKTFACQIFNCYTMIGWLNFGDGQQGV